jgi:predicted alpha/beta-hydrolase family hydrolase
VSVRGVVLFPGSGSSADHPSLLALERAFTGAAVRRCDFPYRLAGRKFPDRGDVLVACVREEVADLARSLDCDTTEIVIGGRSMGGRMCTLAAAGFSGARNESASAQLPLRVAGVMAISYPLHPPGKPDVLRVAHFSRLVTPTLFVSGTRDEFATPDELTSWTARIPGPVDHRWIDGARHDLRTRDDDVAQLCAQWVAGLRH